MLVFAAILCVEICVAAFIVLIFNFATARNYDVIIQMLAVICGVILSGMLFCLVVSETSHKKIRMGSRYTYVDIQRKAVIFSAYGGDYRMNRERMVMRELYYMPFSDFKSLEKDKSGKHIVVSGNFRRYIMNSDNLGYHIKDGDVDFDRRWLNIGGFEEVQTVRIPSVFGKRDSLYESIKGAYAKFLAEPKPKPYVFKEADFIRRRSKPRVMPEEFGYSRKW